MKNIVSNEICASAEDLEVLKDANIYHIEDVTLERDDGDYEGVNIVLKILDGNYINLSFFDDGTVYLSEKY